MDDKGTNPKGTEERKAGRPFPEEGMEGLEERRRPEPKPDPSKGEAVKDFERPSGSPKGTPIDFLLDIPLQISVELGRGRMTIQEILQLGHGSVVALNRLAGEPVDVLINEKLIARGEVVRVNEKLGVRLTDIVSTQERIEKLG